MKFNLYLIFVILLIGIVTAGMQVGDNTDTDIGVSIVPPITTNISSYVVNSSDFWNTAEGVLDDVSDISHADLDNLEWSVAGHTIDTDFLPDTSLSYNIGSPTERWLIAYLSDISTDYLNVTYDANVLGTLFASSLNATFMNITEVNVDYFNVTTINASYIYNPYFEGYMDMRADPWYFGGADLQIAESLIIGGNIDSIGNITAYNITALNDITAGGDVSGTIGEFGTGVDGTVVIDVDGIAFGSDTSSIIQSANGFINFASSNINTLGSVSGSQGTFGITPDNVVMDTSGISLEGDTETIKADGGLINVEADMNLSGYNITSSVKRTSPDVFNLQCGTYAGVEECLYFKYYGSYANFGSTTGMTLISNGLTWKFADNIELLFGGSNDISMGVDSSENDDFRMVLGQNVQTDANVIYDVDKYDGNMTFWRTVQFDDNVNVSGNFTGNQIYGEMYYHNHTATEINFATQYENYTMWFDEADELNGFSHETESGLGSNLTAQVSGLYSADWFAIGDGQNNHIYVGSIFINGVSEEKCKDHKKMSAGGDITTLDASCFIRLSVGDVVDLKVSDWSGTGTSNYYGGNLNLVRIGV